MQRQSIKSNAAEFARANKQATQCLLDQPLLERFRKEVSADVVESDKDVRMQLQENVQC